jgi:hypothetical protein
VFCTKLSDFRVKINVYQNEAPLKLLQRGFFLQYRCFSSSTISIIITVFPAFLSPLIPLMATFFPYTFTSPLLPVSSKMLTAVMITISVIDSILAIAMGADIIQIVPANR